MIRNLQHIAFGVPDMEPGRRFYTAGGLEATERGNNLVLRCFGKDQDQVVLTEAPKRHTHYVSFGTRPDEIAGMQRRIEATDTKLCDAPSNDAPDGLWFADPDGVLVNIQVRDDAPNGNPGERMNSPGDFRRMNVRGAMERTDLVRPRRLGHILLFSPDVKRKVRFYTDVLGMKLSDTVAGGALAFMRCGGDSDHHVLALAGSERPGFHHASFEMGSLDEIVVGARRMADAGYADGWGQGRHVIGSNFFHYTRDPYMGLMEYFWDIDFVTEDADWQIGDWHPDDSFYLWSTNGPPPADFVHNYEGA